MQKPQSSVVLLLIIMAIILAFGSFLALSYIQRRPEVPEGTEITTVEGVEVTVKIDPAKRVRLLSPEEAQANPPPESQGTDQQEQQDQGGQQEQAQNPTTATPTATPEPAVPTPAPDPVIFVDYVVPENDTLYNIANRPDTSIALMARHGIAQDDLVPGTTIQLPVGNPAFCPQDNRQPYAVGEGDTAFSIGKRFNTTADEIKDINGLDENYTVYGAAIICVPQQ